MDKFTALSLKLAIMRKARDFCINKPQVKNLVITNGRKIEGGVFSYEKVNAQVTDKYTCPITGEKKICLFAVEYDGLELKYNELQSA